MNANCPRRRGFSLVEILIVVAVIGVVSTVAIPLVTGVPDAAKKEKLEQDVVVVNNAIDAYLASGGDPGQLTSGDLLAALKSRVVGGMPAEMIGPQGPFLDPTVTTNNTDFSWSAILTAEPRPRFVVEQSAAGVIFGRGPATEVGGVAEQADDARPSWLWSYTETQPLVANAEIFRPGTEQESAISFNPAAVTQLETPEFQPATNIYDLDGSPFMISLVNNNPGDVSRLAFSLLADLASPSFYTNSFALPAPGPVSARAVSFDPSRYANSVVTNKIYYGRPVLNLQAPTKLTYAEALSGGNFVTVSNSATGGSVVHYAIGNAPSLESPVYSAPVSLSPSLWSNSSSITFQVQAFPVSGGYITNSELKSASIQASNVRLNPPVITPDDQIVFGSIPVTIDAGLESPPGTRIFYTYSNDPTTDPTPETGMLYSGPFVVSEFGVAELKYVKARAYAPADLPDFWFQFSEVAGKTYQGLNFDYYNLEGVLVGGGSIANNAALDGSVVLVSVDGLQPNVTFNNNSALTGDIYAPGTPSVLGVSTNRIVNLDGAITPTNYTINIQKADFSGKVYRRITPVTMPVVNLPTGLNLYTNKVTSGALVPGQYSNVDPGNGDTITIGVAGSTQPLIYIFDQFDAGNKFTLNVVGPVILTLNPGSGQTVALGNNVVLGNDDHPEWLQINMNTGNFTVGNGSAMYGSILNPNGTVSFQQNSTFVGGVTAKFINIENNATGVSFSLPPPTVSPTPGPSPTPRPTPAP